MERVSAELARSHLAKYCARRSSPRRTSPSTPCYQPRPPCYQPRPPCYQPRPSCNQPRPFCYQPRPLCYQPRPAIATLYSQLVLTTASCDLLQPFVCQVRTYYNHLFFVSLRNLDGFIHPLSAMGFSHSPSVRSPSSPVQSSPVQSSPVQSSQGQSSQVQSSPVQFSQGPSSVVQSSQRRSGPVQSNQTQCKQIWMSAIPPSATHQTLRMLGRTITREP